jgi:hypothetical protein
MGSAGEQDFRQRLRRVEVLVDALERAADPAARDAARELTQTLLDLHRAGLEKLLALIARPEDCMSDDLLSGLLLLHGLHPVSVEMRVRQALERVGPLLRARGADVKLLAVEERRVRVRLRGEDAVGVRGVIEEAVCEAAPDAGMLEIEEAPTARLPLPLLAGHAPHDPAGRDSR